MERNAVIVYAKRTPIGKIGGILKEWEPQDLIAPLLLDAVQQCNIQASDIDEVILGNVVGPGGNVARLAALTAGFPVHVPGVTVDRQCGAGLEAIQITCRLVQAGAGEIYIAGGVESTSRAPYKIEKPTNIYTQLPRFYGRARFSPEGIGDPDMGVAAENVAEAFTITREQQDAWAFSSHQKAIEAIQSGRLHDLIYPLTAGEQKLFLDECPRPDTSMEKLARLRPVFSADGTVTAGNSCPLNDGAAIVVVMSERKAKELGITPMLRFVDSVSAGVDPNLLGTGPIPAVKKLLHRTGVVIDDISRVEFNEAFASQVLACLHELNIPYAKVNPDGGALAYGHPYGASGAILVTHLAHGLKREQGQGQGRYGLATLGIGGGLGLAVLFERFQE